MKYTAKRLLSLALVLVMCVSLLPAFAAGADALSYEEAVQGVPANSLAYKVLTEDEYFLDLGSWSKNLPLGAGHLQGICSDDKGKYMYASFTNMLVKVDMATGEIVGTVTGMAAGSISSGAHIGDICYYNGKIYGSLEYKAARRWYICVFDGDKITGMDMHYTTPGVMYGLYVPQVDVDFQNTLDSGEDNMSNSYNSTGTMGHRYGTGGIDGITFGTLPGKGYDNNGDGVVDVSTGDKRYMIVTYGPYGNAKRYDNENFVFLVYDPDDITDKNLLPFTEDMLKADYTEEQLFKYKHKMFCYAGNQEYGVQQLEYDEDTGDLWMECYGKASGTEFPAASRYVIDGSVPLYMDTVEVGQSVTGDAEGFVTQAAAHATAALYTDYEDGDGDGNTAEQETGWHMTLKCLCGDGKTLAADHTAQVYGATGKACKICGKSSQFSTGLRSLGNNFFYGASSSSEVINGVEHEWGEAYLYRLNRTNYAFEKITPPAELLMSYTMDAADTYVGDDGLTYIKDTSGNGYDAVVQGTYAAAGVSGKTGTALGFRGDEYGSVVDRVYVSDEGMDYINDKVENTFSYSFWMYNQKEGDRFTPIIGMYRDTDYATGLYQGVIEMRYRKSLAVVSHRNDDPDDATLYNGEVYDRDPGDGCKYIGGDEGGRGWYGNMGVYNKWQHVVLVRSGTNAVVYVDGVKVTSSANIGSSNMDNLSAFEIGGYINRNWVDSNVRTRYTGLIDDVRIYAGGLMDADVTELYNAGKGAADSTATGTGAVAASGDPTFANYTGEILKEQDDPIVHLYMDETGTVKDHSGNHIDAVSTAYVASTANQDGQESRALSFKGMSNVKQTALTMSDENTAWLSAQLNATQKMTISFWMNADFENSHRMSILGVYGKDGKPIGTFETRGKLGQDLRMDGRFAIAFTSAKDYSGTGKIDEKTYEQIAATDTATTYKVNNVTGHYGDKVIHEWYHVVGELDEVNNTMSLYINGELVKTVAIADGTMDEIGYFMVGQPATRYYEYENASNSNENTSDRQGWAMRDGFVGTIDEIRIYNTILGEEKVAALYAEGTEYDAVKLAEEAADAAKEAQKTAEKAAQDAETAQKAAEDAQKAAETAQKAAENAQKEAEAAQKAAETAKTASGENADAAEDAQAAAEAAQKKAEDAQAKAEAAETAAETAKTNAETAKTAAETAKDSAEAAAAAAAQSKSEAALEAAEAAEEAGKAASEAAKAATESQKAAASAADAAEAAAESATYANAAAQSAKDAQVAQKAAEDAAKEAGTSAEAAETAQRAAEAAQKAAEKAALDGARHQAMLIIDTYVEMMDQRDFTAEQAAAMEKAVADAKAAIDAADTADAVQKAMEKSLDTIQGLRPVDTTPAVSIGTNGHWYIDGVDTGIAAAGADGADGADGSTVTIGGNGNWFINGKDTGIAAAGEDGENGSTVSIGSNGNWVIDGKDTGIAAAGVDGVTPKLQISSKTGMWEVSYDNGATWESTGVLAQGEKGADGTGSGIAVLALILAVAAIGGNIAMAAVLFRKKLLSVK